MSIHPYNIWPPRENFPVPHIFGVWQQELNRITGLTPSGLPHLRLEWGSTCTWTPSNRDLKYYYSKRDRQIGWLIDVLDNNGNKIKTIRYGLKANIPEPGRNLGPAYPEMITEQIGIPRFWISQYIPPSLLGPWEEVRERVLRNYNADIGIRPGEGFYYKGFHLISYHGSDGSGRSCCDKAKEARTKCFGLYRDPSDLDILYCTVLWRQAELEPDPHSWTEVANANTMRKCLTNLNNSREGQSEKEREEMKLRIRDAFKTFRGKMTARKGRDTFTFSSQDKIFPGTEIR